MIPRKTFSIRRNKLPGFNFTTGLPHRTPSQRLKIASRRKKPKTLGKLLKKADGAFSLKIRARDGKCQHPNVCPKSNIKDLQCSHFIGRAVKSTRFDPDNCIALCWFHHYKSKEFGLEYHKQTKEKHGFDGWYTKVMQQRLGPTKYLKLIKRSKESTKLTREFLTNLIQELSPKTTPKEIQ